MIPFFLGGMLLNQSMLLMTDFIIAKEIKLGEYRDPLKQPVALIRYIYIYIFMKAVLLYCKEKSSLSAYILCCSMTAMAKDPRAEPRYRERVPYVVVCGCS